MLIPIAVTLVILLMFKKKVTMGEAGIMLLVPAVMVLAGLGIAYCQSVSDIEIWNGRITNKTRDRVSCRHSYSCNCRTVTSGSGKNDTVCDTCHEHGYDIEWNLSASTNETIEIDTVDRQGLIMPPRWGAAYIGEPFSSAHHYQNYILANPSSVLLGGRGDLQKFGALVPGYPAKIYDYYRTNHVINSGGVPVRDMDSWEWLMRGVNGDLGPIKQVNVILLFVKTADPAYVQALKDSWVGGKKNDAIVVIGSLDGRQIAFVDVVSWTPNAMYKIALRDAIMDIGNLDRRDDIVKVIHTQTSLRFQRMEMKNYKYLMSSFQPSTSAMIFLLILGIVSCAGVGYHVVTNQHTEESDNGYRTRFTSSHFRR